MYSACHGCGSSPEPGDLLCGTCGHPVSVQGGGSTSASGETQSRERWTSRAGQAACELLHKVVWSTSRLNLAPLTEGAVLALPWPGQTGRRSGRLGGRPSPLE